MQLHAWLLNQRKALPDQIVTPVEAPRVGDPLVDEDEGGGVAGDEGPQGVAGVSAGAVRLGDERVGLGAPELILNKKGAKIVISNSDPKNDNVKDNFFDELYKNYNINRVTTL